MRIKAFIWQSRWQRRRRETRRDGSPYFKMKPAGQACKPNSLVSMQLAGCYTGRPAGPQNALFCWVFRLGQATSREGGTLRFYGAEAPVEIIVQCPRQKKLSNGAKSPHVRFGSLGVILAMRRSLLVFPNKRTFTVSVGMLKRAMAQSRCTPARCAGARAERPEAS